MTEAEYLDWLPKQTASYAAAKVKSGNWSEDRALELARQQTAELLPLGLKTPQHEICVVEADGRRVGVVWIAIKDSPRGPYAYLYDIEMDETQRGKGHGSKAIAAVEEKLRQRGIKSLLLHVFGYNQEALRLYQRLGFEITNVNMAKNL
jgi:ribosomal protein S18 acetylase RimI-like enzyme